MILIEFVFSLPFVFLLSILVGVLLYGIGYIVAPKRKRTRRSQRESYSCGEHLLSRKFQIKNERFFIYTVFFMIFDVSAFLLALSSTADALYALMFCATLVLSIFTLHVIRRRES
jgi:NADH:ubiquinone oxidoreductase subunit 3 (subunit A)